MYCWPLSLPLTCKLASAGPSVTARSAVLPMRYSCATGAGKGQRMAIASHDTKGHAHEF
jgi:hypothetical protein